ncbi:hypothetical protein [Aneurinibacillus migulanus]|uniref:Uncharacterized protein n=1 Tax=Aneurinibacillus migulanus TaxID=47500 RepID=A0A0D1Y0W8_ANEMI|nr:hypothetical protein [Aneurinibacillus migulanus]KIV52897.1 hypothetical protein TS65_22625 [Aneurinibacillus migulanus]KON95174.1 hypothetical protein AF333_06465 [Aneurinibacillus migulanus]MED0890909.1 hypothetical protein [Aneurinibacillus migulanus]MED1616601.1 hypothetical protein [Aneurinibacillus migulanus]SDI82323.1 hypothetical protein SAMN04487909_10864 [Aneurinibacillus migulanus]
MEKVKHLQKLLGKTASMIFIQKFSKYIDTNRIPILELSRTAGKPDNAFSKTRAGEDPYLSTFLRYWFSCHLLAEKNKVKEPVPPLDSFFDQEVQKVLSLIYELAENGELSKASKKSLSDLQVYINILTKNGEASMQEKEVYKEIIYEINHQEE